MSLLKRTASAAQLLAARTNGAKSRGPVTPQGKRNSSANSRRYPNYFAIVDTLTPDEILEHDEIINELATSYPPRNTAEIYLIRFVARERIYLLHYWRFENAIIDASQPCPGILCHISRRADACVSRLNPALMTIASDRPSTENTKTPERTVHIVESKTKTPEFRTHSEPNYPHFRRQKSPRKTPKPVPAIIAPLRTRSNHG
ncbi:MAG: hypothetical protein QOJ99_4867 [Bryobacterales bacterium]|nr:hypothetical protein [Bryobacterales bacterium]